MHGLILWTVVAAGLLVALLGAATSVAGRQPGRSVLAAVGLAESVTVVQSVVAGVELAGGHHVLSTATFLGYVIGIVVVLPIAVVWAWADRNRWSGAVIAVGGLTVAVMSARLLMMWQGRA
jgi:hypothetical protein